MTQVMTKTKTKTKTQLCGRDGAKRFRMRLLESFVLECMFNQSVVLQTTGSPLGVTLTLHISIQCVPCGRLAATKCFSVKGVGAFYCLALLSVYCLLKLRLSGWLSGVAKGTYLPGKTFSSLLFFLFLSHQTYFFIFWSLDMFLFLQPCSSTHH